MPSEMSNSLRNLLVSQVITEIYLLHIEASEDIRFANWDSNVTFNGNVYARYPFKVGTLRSSASGGVPGVTITTPSADGDIVALLDTYDSFVNCPIHIIKVFDGFLSDSTMFIKQTFTVESGSGVLEEKLELQCAPKLFKGVACPRRTWFRNTCQWKYKKEGCWEEDGAGGWQAPSGFDDLEGYCLRTHAHCREHGNYARFSGAPAIPWSNPYVP